MIKTYPILYRKTSTGRIQEWLIQVRGKTIHYSSGQLDGEKTCSEDATFGDGAIAEALVKWENKKKEGFVELVKDAKNGASYGVLNEQN